MTVIKSTKSKLCCNCYLVYKGSTQPFETLKLAVCVAAKCGAMQFIKTVFSSKAGRAICKEIPLLPQLIAREHGYEEIANYLEELTTR